MYIYKFLLCTNDVQFLFRFALETGAWIEVREGYGPGGEELDTFYLVYETEEEKGHWYEYLSHLCSDAGEGGIDVP